MNNTCKGVNFTHLT